MTRSLRFPLLAAGTALLLTGCGTPAPSIAPSPRASSAASSPAEAADASCADAVEVTIDVRDTASGWAYLVLRNAGAASCPLTGFPAVIAVDPEGGSVGDPAEPTDRFSRAGTEIVLEPGQRAYAELIYTPAEKVDLGDCGPRMPMRGFSVTVPGAAQEEFVDVPGLTFCLGLDGMSLSKVGPVDSEARPASG